MAPPRRRSAVDRKQAPAHPDDTDTDVGLAPRVRPQQLIELFALGYRGPTPSTEGQAEQVLQQWRRKAASSPAPSEERP